MPYKRIQHHNYIHTMIDTALMICAYVLFAILLVEIYRVSRINNPSSVVDKRKLANKLLWEILIEEEKYSHLTSCTTSLLEKIQITTPP